ncbi:hypothetical protein C8R45DRAFT_1095289 [Mycena sanguinolenta]|nr:hypothetical protein C8R45DRAFT_1095289 [Mycena sanguinolenta]
MNTALPSDDIELLPFVEAIPDMIHGPNGFRRANHALFEGLLGTIEVTSPLVTRIYLRLDIRNGKNVPERSPSCPSTHCWLPGNMGFVLDAMRAGSFIRRFRA